MSSNVIPARRAFSADIPDYITRHAVLRGKVTKKATASRSAADVNNIGFSQFSVAVFRTPRRKHGSMTNSVGHIFTTGSPSKIFRRVISPISIIMSGVVFALRWGAVERLTNKAMNLKGFLLAIRAYANKGVAPPPANAQFSHKHGFGIPNAAKARRLISLYRWNGFPNFSHNTSVINGRLVPC